MRRPGHITTILSLQQKNISHRTSLLSNIHFSITTASTPPILPTCHPAHHTPNLSICPLQVHKAPNSSTPHAPAGRRRPHARRSLTPNRRTPHAPAMPTTQPCKHHKLHTPGATSHSPISSRIHGFALPAYIHFSITTASPPPLLPTRLPAHHTPNLFICPLQVN